MTDRQLLIDSIIAEAVFRNELIKNAEGGALSSLVGAVSDYVSSKIDPNNKAESVINLIVPATFVALGGPFRILGFMLQIAESVFGLSIGKIITSIGNEIKQLIVGGGTVSSEQVNNITQQAVLSNGGGEATEQEYKSYLQSKSLTLSDAMFFKKASDNYINLEKTAKLPGAGFATFLKSKNKTTSILVALISIVIRTILWAGGFMLAEDSINKLIGKPNYFDGNADKRYPNGIVPTTDNSITPGFSNQKVFAVNPNYREENLNNKYNTWVVGGSIDQIDNVILQWSIDVYPDLKNHVNEVKNSNGFQTIVNVIQSYNANNNTGAIFIPPSFKSRKQIVDKFIDEVVKNVSSTPLPNPPVSNQQGSPLTA